MPGSCSGVILGLNACDGKPDMSKTPEAPAESPAAPSLPGLVKIVPGEPDLVTTIHPATDPQISSQDGDFAIVIVTVENTGIRAGGSPSIKGKPGQGGTLTGSGVAGPRYD